MNEYGYENLKNCLARHSVGNYLTLEMTDVTWTTPMLTRKIKKIIRMKNTSLNCLSKDHVVRYNRLRIKYYKSVRYLGVVLVMNGTRLEKSRCTHGNGKP